MASIQQTGGTTTGCQSVLTATCAKDSTSLNHLTNGPAQTHRLLCCDPDPLQPTRAAICPHKKKEGLLLAKRRARAHPSHNLRRTDRRPTPLPADMHVCDCLQSGQTVCMRVNARLKAVWCVCQGSKQHQRQKYHKSWSRLSTQARPGECPACCG
jgi:hypothetical protein